MAAINVPPVGQSAGSSLTQTSPRFAHIAFLYGRWPHLPSIGSIRASIITGGSFPAGPGPGFPDLGRGPFTRTKIFLRVSKNLFISYRPDGLPRCKISEKTILYFLRITQNRYMTLGPFFPIEQQKRGFDVAEEFYGMS